jgi:hypothetical protein
MNLKSFLVIPTAKTVSPVKRVIKRLKVYLRRRQYNA